MEWLEGEDLAHRLRRASISLAEVLTLLRCVSEALEVAHQAGLLHRDLKPSNLFLRDGQIEQVTLIDFGLARRALGGAQITQTGVVVGTPEYMSPEQARGDRQIGPSSDIFALGCVAFECLTGQPPFVGEHLATILSKILFEEPTPLNKIRPDLPEPLVQLIGRMLAKNPLARIASAMALRAELDALGELQESATHSTPSVSGNLRYAMVGGEQALISVVIAQSVNGAHHDQITMDSTHLRASASQTESLRGMLMQFGVSLESLADGSLIATIARQGAATEQAIQAVRCAMTIKERFPDSIVALATGRAVLEDTTMFGEVLGRVGEMIETAKHTPDLPQGLVILDETSSRLVESHFNIIQGSNHLLLLGGLAQAADDARMVLGVPTQCVGRERELNLLDASFSSCDENGSATVVLVIAPPGAGKSRLRHEFLRRLQTRYSDFGLLTGRGDPMSAGASYGLLAQALRRQFGLIDNEDVKIRQEKIQTCVRERVPRNDAQRVSEFLGELCGTSFPDSVLLRAARQDPRVMGDQVSQAFVDFLRGECDKHSVLLLLEDLHWGDALTVKLVDSAIRELIDRPFMVLALARPEIEDLFPKLWSERARQDIRLGGLPKRAAERLIAQVLGNKLDPKIAARIIEQAAGNALFLEELIRAAAEGKTDELPGTVLAVLHARLMRMAPEGRRILRAASIFGETFWEGGVRKLIGRERTGEQCESWLQILVESEIIERHRESRFPGEVEYAFRHGLVRDAAYGMLPDEDRLLGHYLAGCYLEEVGESDPMVLAEHFQRGCDMVRATSLYTRAAEQAYEGNDLDGVMRRAERGLSCGAEGEIRGALYALQTVACFWRNDLQFAVRAGTEALELLPAGTLHWFRAIGFATASAAALGMRAQVSELSHRFGTMPPADDIVGSYVEATSILATMLTLIGDRQMAELFLNHAEQTGTPVAESQPHVRGWMTYARGRFLHALEPVPYTTMQHFQIAFDAFVESGDRRMAVSAAGDLGYSLARLGKLAEGTAVIREALSLAANLDDPITLFWGQLHLALVLSEQRHPETQAEAELLAQSILNSFGDHSYYGGIAGCTLASVHLAAGDLLQAETVARRAIGTLRAAQTSAPLGYITLGRILLAQGQAAEAVDVAIEGVEIVDALKGSGGSEIPMRMLLVDALEMQGDHEKADLAREILHDQINIRLQEIPDPSLRESFLARLEAPGGIAPLF